MPSAERLRLFVATGPRLALILLGTRRQDVARRDERRTAYIPLTRSRLPLRLLHLESATKGEGKEKGTERVDGILVGRMRLVARFASHFELHCSPLRLLLPLRLVLAKSISLVLFST